HADVPTSALHSFPTRRSSDLHDCLKKAGVRINGIDGFVHGSTIAINTVLERRGARTALIVTKGTRDVYKIGRGNRPDAYDIWFKDRKSTRLNSSHDQISYAVF